jgi:O6-methylguanine-DNA--protein-cysteine methyltransferase
MDKELNDWITDKTNISIASELDLMYIAWKQQRPTVQVRRTLRNLHVYTPVNEPDRIYKLSTNIITIISIFDTQTISQIQSRNKFAKKCYEELMSILYGSRTR